MILRLSDITPCMKVKNEDYWIYYVLRDMMRVFGRFIMLDTGSTDGTKRIATKTAIETGCNFTLIEASYGDDANAIGNSPNLLRERCPTYWMLLVDGDELWRTDQLRKLDGLEVPDGKTVLMVTGRNLCHVDGKIMERDGFNADRLFAPDVRWHLRTDYPFESHGLENRVAAGQVGYLNLYFWHIRHLIRSNKDDEAYFRQKKCDYFPYEGPYKELPPDWLGALGPYDNPYIGKAE